MIQTELFSVGNTKKTKAIRSPLFYVGDKYKLMPQLIELFPKNINTFFDVFSGGGSASINTRAKKIIMNDIDTKVIDLHEHLQMNSTNIDNFILEMYKLIKVYNLSHSELGKNEEIEKLKIDYPKTYFSKFNKESYLSVRKDYNSDQSKVELLYLLLIYGFNHMIRFNKKGEFNLPVGNVDWNKNVTLALRNYAEWYNKNEIELSSGKDFEDFIDEQNIEEGDFLYFDPPYLITFSDYNKLWGEEDEKRLYNLLDKLDEQGIYWGLSNMLYHKGNENLYLLKWAEKYNEFEISSNYISRFDNSIKKNSKEVYITNYKNFL